MPPALPTPSPESELRCGNCGAPMRVLSLPGHYGQAVEIDLCGSCHLVWFDAVESARVAGPALLELIGAMAQAQAQTLPHQPLRTDAACPHCRAGLKPVHNRTRWGPSLQLECRSGHGAWQTFAEYLTEKGLLRPMSSIDRAQLLARDGRIDCVNCGAAIGADDATCPFCRSVPSLFDVARLARALDPEGATAAAPVHATPARRGAMQCLACGAALAPERSMRCPSCGATLAVSRLAEALAAVGGLAQTLHDHRARPAPELVRARLAAQSTDIPRRRAWVRQMQAEADAQRGAQEAPLVTAWSDGHWRPWHVILVLAAVVLIWFLA